MNPHVVICRKVTRLRRGDRILAVRPCSFGKRAAGVNVNSRVLGTFIMRKERPNGDVAIVYRNADGVVVGHESTHSREDVAFVLAEREPSKEEVPGV